MEDGEKRLPSLLRAELNSLTPAIDLFNPRGEELAKIPLIQEFGGLLLTCLDPNDEVTPVLRSIGKEAKDNLTTWRSIADECLKVKASNDLRRYIQGWKKRKNESGKWPREVPVIDLIYDLRYWFPEFQQDPEQQVYFETFTRQLQAAEELGAFSGQVITDPKNAELSTKSIEHLLRDFLGPIAAGVVGVNEELVTAFPRDRIPVLSIHQSKGLEFPVVIVDVGSRFKTNSHVQRRFRFPDDADVPERLEDAMRLPQPKKLHLRQSFWRSGRVELLGLQSHHGEVRL
jgi:DNA helicase-2/ATP-dependent DNA helicase PcrA